MFQKCTMVFVCLTTILLGYIKAWPQDFDYRLEESPAVSWNGVDLFDAALLATGGISLLGSAHFSALSNPALLGETREFTIAVSAGSVSYQSYQYWGVNQGVIKASEGLSESRFLPSGFSMVIPLKKIHFSLGWAVSDILDFPDFDQDQYDWGYSGQFSGKEDRFFLAAAINPTRAFSMGIMLEYLKGNRRINMVEHYYYSGGYYSLIQQQEQHRSTALSASLGMSVEISSSWKLGMVFRYPFSGEVEREITRLFQNNFPSPDIVDQASATDDLYRPESLRLGASFTPSFKKKSGSEKKITLAVEAEYVWWSRYEFVFFQEVLERNIDVVTYDALHPRIRRIILEQQVAII